MDRFIVKLEWFDSLEELSNEEKGIFFQNLYNYHSNLPLNTDVKIVNGIWKAILPNIIRMNDSYKSSIENGKKGGAPKGTVPWNKRTQTEPKPNLKEPKTNQDRTFKEKEKEKEKENINNDISTSTIENFFLEPEVKSIPYGELPWESLDNNQKKVAEEYLDNLLLNKIT
jgi:hypothetical protein